MKLIVGLGNPGTEYDRTRHNVGFDVIDRLARRLAPGETARSKFHGVAIETNVEGEKLMLLRPVTFMNRSGQSVSEAVAFYKLDPEADVLVIVDDTALPCGSIRVREAGSSGGHNGLEDVRQRLGTDRWARLRIGIDAPGQIPLKSYVLGKFRPEQQEQVDVALDTATTAALCWLSNGTTETMNRFNTRTSA